MPQHQIILIAGGTGMIGRALRTELESRGHRVFVLSRQGPKSGVGTASHDDSTFMWSPGTSTLDLKSIAQSIGAPIDAIVNLAGSTIAKMPWTKRRKNDILQSRIVSTTEVVDAIVAMPVKARPKTLLNASAVGFYGSRGDEPLDESSSMGTGFLADVTAQWEATALKLVSHTKTRVVLARTGLVLGATGALSPLRLLTRLFVAGPLGGGKVWWPWISLRDEVRALVFLIENSAISGPVNLVGPRSATSADVMRTLARLLRRPFWLPAPHFAISAGLGEAGRELLLSSQKVEPRVLEKAGFDFTDTSVESALAHALNPSSS